MPRLLKQEEIILNTSQNIKSRDKGRKREREREEREREREREGEKWVSWLQRIRFCDDKKKASKEVLIYIFCKEMKQRDMHRIFSWI